MTVSSPNYAPGVLSTPGYGYVAGGVSDDMLVGLVRDARDQADAGRVPREIGDHTLAMVVPDGHRVELIDVRQHEDSPRRPVGSPQFVTVASFVAYHERYDNAHALVYAADPNGNGRSFLTRPMGLVSVVFDDHPAERDRGGTREHTADLVVKPTPAARRWAAPLNGDPLDQESFLDLVTDGIGEIAEPDGGALRDLVADLHAIRTTEVKSVFRTGGEGRIELAENVTLRTGPGNTVTFPERIRLMFCPFVRFDLPIAVDVRVKARVRNDHVTFELTAPDLDTSVAAALEQIVADVEQATGVPVLWIP